MKILMKAMRLLIFIIVLSICKLSVAMQLDYKKEYAKSKKELSYKVIGKSALSEELFMSASGKYGTKNVHGQITEAALADKVSTECLNQIINANTNQDDGVEENVSTNHFDNSQICQSYNVIKERFEKIKSEKKRQVQLNLFGQILHAYQDFYSHSNYVETNVALNDEIRPQDIDLFDFTKFCTSRDFYEKKLGKIFTGFYEGHHGMSNVGVSDEDYQNPYSHLHWNKDVSPKDNPKTAKYFSRSSLKRTKNGKGTSYFDLAFGLQVRHTQKTFEELKSYISNLDKNCRL